MKMCSECGTEKEFFAFPRIGRNDARPRPYCKLCSKQKQKVWDAARYQRLLKENPGLLKLRDSLGKQKTKAKHERLGDKWVLHFIQSLKKRHTLLLEDYLWLFEQQRGKCALCARVVNWQFKGLHIDHDHACAHTSHQISCKMCIRGLLCYSCNRQHLPWTEKDVALQGSRVREYLTRRPFRTRMQVAGCSEQLNFGASAKQNRVALCDVSDGWEPSSFQ